MIKAIIIDWHGVIDKKNWKGLVQLMSQESNKTLEESKSLIGPITNKSILGEVEPAVAWQKVKSLFNFNDHQIDKLKEYVLNIDFDKEVVNFLEDNKNKYKIILLTDCPEDKAEVIKKSVAKLFDKMYFSCYSHKSKKDSEFFADAAKDFKLLPEECLYIDDKEQPIAKAASLGFNVCLFKQGIDLGAVLGGQ